MPQLDISFYSSQIFWFIIVFSCVLLYATYYISPIYEAISNLRNSKINENLIEAENLKEQAIEIQKKYELANKQLALDINDIYLQENKKLEAILKTENQKFEEKIALIEQTTNQEIEEIKNKFKLNIENEEKKLVSYITEKVTSVINKDHKVK